LDPPWNNRGYSSKNDVFPPPPIGFLAALKDARLAPLMVVEHCGGIYEVRHDRAHPAELEMQLEMRLSEQIPNESQSGFPPFLSLFSSP